MRFNSVDAVSKTVPSLSNERFKALNKSSNGNNESIKSSIACKSSSRSCIADKKFLQSRTIDKINKILPNSCAFKSALICKRLMLALTSTKSVKGKGPLTRCIFTKAVV